MPRCPEYRPNLLQMLVSDIHRGHLCDRQATTTGEPAHRRGIVLIQLKTSMQEPSMLKICNVWKNSLKFGQISGKGARSKHEKQLRFVTWQCSVKFGFACVLPGISQHNDKMVVTCERRITGKSSF